MAKIKLSSVLGTSLTLDIVILEYYNSLYRTNTPAFPFLCFLSQLLFTKSIIYTLSKNAIICWCSGLISTVTNWIENSKKNNCKSSSARSTAKWMNKQKKPRRQKASHYLKIKHIWSLQNPTQSSPFPQFSPPNINCYYFVKTKPKNPHLSIKVSKK